MNTVDYPCAHSPGIEYSTQEKFTISDAHRLEAGIRRRGIFLNKVSLFSVHITGSGRMEGSETSCKDNAEMYAPPGLVIWDACVFPTSPGISDDHHIVSCKEKRSKD